MLRIAARHVSISHFPHPTTHAPTPRCHVSSHLLLCISCRTDRFLPMIPAFLLVLSVAAYRIITGLLIHSGATWLSNFTPLAAIALCSAAYFPTKYKFSVPLLTLFIS